MSLFYVRSKVCIAPFNVRSKVCIDPIHGRSKVCKFAPHMDGSNADFSLHMEGIHLLSLQSQPVWDLSGSATKWTRIFDLFIFFFKSHNQYVWNWGSAIYNVGPLSFYSYMLVWPWAMNPWHFSDTFPSMTVGPSYEGDAAAQTHATHVAQCRVVPCLSIHKELLMADAA